MSDAAQLDAEGAAAARDRAARERCEAAEELLRSAPWSRRKEA